MIGDGPPIDGVTITELRQITDERGTVLHLVRDDPHHTARIGEVYFSEVLPGAVKAWKRHRLQTQNLAVPVGRVRLVVFDARPESLTNGNLRVLELGRPDSYVRVRIPPWLWYGFACAGNAPALLANCADIPHDPSESESRPADDPAIPYEWGRGGGAGSP